MTTPHDWKLQGGVGKKICLVKQFRRCSSEKNNGEKIAIETLCAPL